MVKQFIRYEAHQVKSMINAIHSLRDQFYRHFGVIPDGRSFTLLVPRYVAQYIVAYYAHEGEIPQNLNIDEMPVTSGVTYITDLAMHLNYQDNVILMKNDALSFISDRPILVLDGLFSDDFKISKL